MKDVREHRPSTNPATFAGRVFLGLLIIVGFLAVWKAREIVLIALLGVLFGVGLTPLIDWLARHKIRRGFGVVLVLLVSAGIIWGLWALVGASLSGQISEIRQQLPHAIDNAYGSIRQAIPIVDLPPPGQAQEQVTESIASSPGALGGRLFTFFRGLTGVIGGIVLVISMALYSAAQPHVYSRSMVMLFGEGNRRTAGAVTRDIAHTWRQWLFAQLISMSLIAVLTTLALWLIGVRGVFALGLLAGIAEFIPVFGPILSAVPALAIASLDSPQQALWVLLAYIVIQQIESNIITPLVMKEAVEIPPVITILAGSLFFIFAGFAGLLMAVPLLAALITAGRHFLGDEFLQP